MNPITLIITSGLLPHLIHAEMEAARRNESIVLVEAPQRPDPEAFMKATKWVAVNFLKPGINIPQLKQSHFERSHPNQPYYATLKRRRRK